MDESKTSQLVDHLFRHSYGKMVAVLSRFLGFAHLDAIEDIIQEAFIRAIRTWKGDNLPDNPTAWLITVAKRLAIDYIRKQKAAGDRLHHLQLSGPALVHIEELFLESEIPDNQLRLMFATCHPKLDIRDRVALTLKFVSGFGISEIARALLMSPEAVKKRIQRARKSLSSNNIELSIPIGTELQKRLETVHLVLYLLFNEGYYSTSNANPVSKDICIEAMRLCHLLSRHRLTDHPDTHALLALMCLHASRFDSRTGNDGEVVLLENQDRTYWDRQLIALGMFHLNTACKADYYSTYHYEALISSEHARASSFNETNWLNINQHYKSIYALKPGEQILLNQVIVLVQLQNIEEAIDLFETIDKDHIDRVLYLSVASDLALKSGNAGEARELLIEASRSNPSVHEMKVIEQKVHTIDSEFSDYLHK